MTDRFLVGLDRDGTIIDDAGQSYFGRDPDWRSKLKIYPEVPQGIKILNSDTRSSAVVTTNQAGVANGYYGTERCEEVNAHLRGLLLADGLRVEGFYYCPFVDSDYAKKKGLALNNSWVMKKCEDRKPRVGMLRRAARDLGLALEDFSMVYYVGDKTSDVETGLNAKGKGVLVFTGEYKKDYDAVKTLAAKSRGYVLIADNLRVAAEMILYDFNRG